MNVTRVGARFTFNDRFFGVSTSVSSLIPVPIGMADSQVTSASASKSWSRKTGNYGVVTISCGKPQLILRRRSTTACGKIMPLLDTLCDGVGPVCHELNIAPSTYYRHREYRQHPEKRSLRDRRDDLLRPEIQRVYGGNYSVYGIRKVWRQLQREGFSVARCTIARLMKAMGLAGVLRGKKCAPRSAGKTLRQATG